MTILFQDNFATDGPLDSSYWDYNHWQQNNNPSFLGQTQMRQSLPLAQGGMARIQLDTWLDGNAFSGSEAITRQAFALPGNGGGIAFEGRFKFEGNQGGMIAGFFSYQDFPPGAVREPHDEIDFEILTTQLQKISTNVFAHESDNTNPKSIGVTPGSFGDFHTYRMEWFPDHVSWFVLLDSGQWYLLRTETDHIPTQPQQLHLNLWGVPAKWGPSPGDPGGPPIGDPNFTPATSKGDNKTYYFDVTGVKVEQLSTPTVGAVGR
jgi:beta-glucanase (GH16 family)